MARIRTIKPETPLSESLSKVSREARLTFILLWTIADDEGRARAASRALASALYPYDDDAPGLIDGWLCELEGAGKIRRYVVDGSTYLEIINWLEHQKIDRPTKSRLPAFVEGSRALVEPSSTDLVPSTLDLVPSTNAREARETIDEVSRLFEEFWAEYPERAGGNPKAPAVKSFARAIATGRKHEINREVAGLIVGGAKRFAAECRDRGKIGTEFVPHASTWLNQRRWEGYPEKSAADPAMVPGKVHVTGERWEAWDRFSRETAGRSLPRDKAGGWWVDSDLPPDIEPKKDQAA